MITIVDVKNPFYDAELQIKRAELIARGQKLVSPINEHESPKKGKITPDAVMESKALN